MLKAKTPVSKKETSPDKHTEHDHHHHSKGPAELQRPSTTLQVKPKLLKGPTIGKHKDKDGHDHAHGHDHGKGGYCVMKD